MNVPTETRIRNVASVNATDALRATADKWAKSQLKWCTHNNGAESALIIPSFHHFIISSQCFSTPIA